MKKRIKSKYNIKKDNKKAKLILNRVKINKVNQILNRKKNVKNKL
jgi:hypothetical protein